MKISKIVPLLILIPALVLILTGCGGEDETSTASGNGIPVINSLTAIPDSVSVDLGQISTLTVSASDPDGGQLTYTWDATAGSLASNGGTSVVWTAPDEVVQSVVIITVFDADSAAATASYTFKYDAFAALIDPPEFTSTLVVPGHARIVLSNTTQIQWWMDMRAVVALDTTPASDIIWLTAEAQNGTVYNLRDDGIVPDITSGDNQFYAYPGGQNMEIQLGDITFIATNRYAKTDTAVYNLSFKCDSLPIFIYPDPDSGEGEYVGDDILAYYSGTPEFKWEQYTAYGGADSLKIALTDTTYHFYLNQSASLIFWMPEQALPGDATSAVYNYDNTATMLQLQNYTLTGQQYILHLIVYKDNAWVRREAKVRRIEPEE